MVFNHIQLSVLIILGFSCDLIRGQFEAQRSGSPLRFSSNATHFNDSLVLSADILNIIAIMSDHVSLQIRIIHDHHHKDTLSQLTQFPIGLKGIAILDYDKAIKNLGWVLAPATREVIILPLCSPQHILEIFLLMKNQKLRSAVVQWMLILKKSQEKFHFTRELELIVLEGTRITILKWVSTGTFQVSSSKVDFEGYTRFPNTETMDFLSVRNISDFLLTDTESSYLNMEGRRLRATANPLRLFAELGPPTADGIYLQYSGVETDLLQALSYKLNFTFVLMKTIDGSWGDLHADGTSTGMIGMVYRGEADIALPQISIRRSRTRAVDYTVPYHLGTRGILSRAPAVKNPTFIVFSPFSVQVWLCLIVNTFIVAFFLKFLSNMTENSAGEVSLGSIQSIFYKTFRSTVNQGELMDTNYWSHRTLLCIWYFFCLVTIALYSGTLVAMLAIPSYEKPIDSLTDLPRAASEGFIIGTNGQTAMEYLFRDATEGIYRDTWLLFNHDDLSKSLVTKEEGISMVTQKKFVFIYNQFLLETEATIRGRSRYHVSRDSFTITWVAMVITKGAPFKMIFDIVILRMVEGGLVDKWKKNAFMRLKRTKTTEGNSGPLTIKLIHLQAAFYVLLLGNSIATCVFGIRMVYLRLT